MHDRLGEHNAVVCMLLCTAVARCAGGDATGGALSAMRNHHRPGNQGGAAAFPQDGADFFGVLAEPSKHESKPPLDSIQRHRRTAGYALDPAIEENVRESTQIGGSFA